ncbi:hypothetical protein ACHAXA_006562 [Cyclostephanos tholiformis]|uniref:Uncharacterized protein n=1 Tax=Cyclostephanos tholiformis TaxID=382380 RepID=A0ABD3RSM2_9STRA
MHANAKRRRLRTDAVVPDVTDGGSYTELVVVGYTDGGIPLYEKERTSNVTDDVVADGGIHLDDVDGEEDQASYAYECASEQYCNAYAPGNSFDYGWTFVGMCGGDGDCPLDAFDESSESYVTGDRVAISSDYLNRKVIGSISCPVVEASGGIATNNVTVLVSYAYEVETSQVSTVDIVLPRLEERLLLTLADTLMSCLGTRQVGNEEARYDVQGIESTPDDVAITEGPCSISNVGADNCFVVNGWMTLLLVPLDNGAREASVMAATDAAQTKIQSAMEEDNLLSPTMPEVIKVKYLDNSYEDYRAAYSVESLGHTESKDDDAGGGGQASLGVILGSVFGALLLLILLVLLCVRLRRARSGSGRNRKAEVPNLMDDASSVNDNRHEGSSGLLETLGGVLLLKSFWKKARNIPEDGKKESDPDSPGTDESDDGLDDIIGQIDGATDANDRRIFVVDPPGAFHLGNHHYTGDGVRYYSPLCELCLAARANADGVVTVNAINADDDDDSDDGGMNLNDGLSFDLEVATKFIDFNSNDLGRCHSSMHVRTCKTTTCPICIKEKGVYFVKSRGPARAR